MKSAEQWLKSKRDAELLLQLAFDNRLDVSGKEWKKKGIEILQSAYRVYTPSATVQLTGSKPKVKSEFIFILEPEIIRRIAGLVVDSATKGADQEQPENNSDNSDCD